MVNQAFAPAECIEAFGASSRELLTVARGAPINRSAALARMIETDVIPRLMLARGADDATAAATVFDVDAEGIQEFAAMMVALDLRKAHMVVSRALDAGVTVESVLLDLLAPTAQRLGQMWVDDDLTFTDVTVGLCTLQNLLRGVTAGDAAEPKRVFDGRILVAAAPGEQHTFGVLMLETMFRRAGWEAVGMPLCDLDEIRAAVSRQMFSVVGFSLSQESALGELATLIGAVRAASMNRKIVVMVGGRVFNDAPDLVRQVGADLTAQDGRGAVIASENLVCSRVRTH